MVNGTQFSVSKVFGSLLTTEPEAAFEPKALNDSIYCDAMQAIGRTGFDHSNCYKAFGQLTNDPAFVYGRIIGGYVSMGSGFPSEPSDTPAVEEMKKSGLYDRIGQKNIALIKMLAGTHINTGFEIISSLALHGAFERYDLLTIMQSMPKLFRPIRDNEGALFALQDLIKSNGLERLSLTNLIKICESNSSSVVNSYAKDMKNPALANIPTSELIKVYEVNGWENNSPCTDVIAADSEGKLFKKYGAAYIKTYSLYDKFISGYNSEKPRNAGLAAYIAQNLDPEVFKAIFNKTNDESAIAKLLDIAMMTGKEELKTKLIKIAIACSRTNQRDTNGWNTYWNETYYFPNYGVLRQMATKAQSEDQKGNTANAALIRKFTLPRALEILKLGVPSPGCDYGYVYILYPMKRAMLDTLVMLGDASPTVINAIKATNNINYRSPYQGDELYSLKEDKAAAIAALTEKE